MLVPLLLASSCSALAGTCCNKPRDPDSAHAAPSASAAPSGLASGSTPAAASAPPSASYRPPLSDGCVTGLDSPSEPDELWKMLEARCLQGMALLAGVTRRMTLASERQATVSLPIEDPTRCIRVVAVAESLGSELEVEVQDETNARLARDTLEGPLALAPSFGPLCVAEARPLQIVVRVRGSADTVALRAYQAE